MRIKGLEYYNKALEWKLERVDFSDLTLLVGVSGVGKTRILNAILDLKEIANGSLVNGLEWSIKFLTEDEVEYHWQGEFENKGFNYFPDEDNEESQPKIVYEKLSINQELIVDRDQSRILFKNKETPKLSPFESVIKILRREEAIAPAYNNFGKIIYSDQPKPTDGIHKRPPLLEEFDLMEFGELVEFGKLMKENISLEDIRDNDLPTQLKLALVYKHHPEVFSRIQEHFIDIFPQVENIKIELVRDKTISSLFVESPLLQIKEKGIHNWIDQWKLSSGMLRSLKHISELYLLAEGTVVLIDEFENSLGVNCIDVLTEDLLSENRNLQFIITSHHPYIINNIGMEHWKIVTRRGGIVTVKEAKDFNLGKSRHDAFIQLINLEEYKEGIAS